MQTESILNRRQILMRQIFKQQKMLKKEEEEINRFMVKQTERMPTKAEGRYSVLENLRAGKGVTPPAKMIKEDSLAVSQLPDFAKKFGRDVEKAVKDGELSANAGARLIREKQAEASEIMNQGLQLTEGEKALDEAFAKDLVEFNQADVEKGLSQLNEAVELLSTNDNITGPFVSLMPEFFQSRANPQATEVKEAVEEVVQRNLRLVLGAQFTEKEGERLIKRAFNPNLPEAENKKRVQRLIKSIQTSLDEKIRQRGYFSTFGTLKGYNYNQASYAKFESDMIGDEETDSTAPATEDQLNRIKELEALEAKRKDQVMIKTQADAQARIMELEQQLGISPTVMTQADAQAKMEELNKSLSALPMTIQEFSKMRKSDAERSFTDKALAFGSTIAEGFKELGKQGIEATKESEGLLDLDAYGDIIDIGSKDFVRFAKTIGGVIMDEFGHTNQEELVREYMRYKDNFDYYQKVRPAMLESDEIEYKKLTDFGSNFIDPFMIFPVAKVGTFATKTTLKGVQKGLTAGANFSRSQGMVNVAKGARGASRAVQKLERGVDIAGKIGAYPTEMASKLVGIGLRKGIKGTALGLGVGLKTVGAIGSGTAKVASAPRKIIEAGVNKVSKVQRIWVE